MIGNCNNPSQASASESQRWLQFLLVTAAKCMTTEGDDSSSLRHKLRVVTMEVIGEGTQVSPAIIQGHLSFVEYPHIRLDWALGGGLHVVTSFLSTIFFAG